MVKFHFLFPRHQHDTFSWLGAWNPIQQVKVGQKHVLSKVDTSFAMVICIYFCVSLVCLAWWLQCVWKHRSHGCSFICRSSSGGIELLMAVRWLLLFCDVLIKDYLDTCRRNCMCTRLLINACHVKISLMCIVDANFSQNHRTWSMSTIVCAWWFMHF